MFEFLKKFASRSSTPGSTLSMPTHAEHATNSHLEVFGGVEAGDLAVTRYPPFDKGIPLIEIDTLIRSQADLITRIFRTAGVSREEFNERFDPPIRNLAKHIHLLPATSTTYFRGTGGLFRMSLEVALNSLQSANGSVFPITGGVERRFFIQPKWSLAIFLAGLCSQNYRTLNSMVVISRENDQWAPLINHLYDWAHKKNIDRYHVRWLEDSPVHGAKASGAYSINHIVPAEVLQYLASDNNQIFQAMTAAIAGVETNASENPVSRIVAPIITRVIEEDLNRSATNYGHLVIGTHLEPHLVDAMRRLVRDGKWAPNQPGGRVWIGREGIFIDWHEASADISQVLSKDSFAGVPKDPDSLASLLINAGLLEMNKSGELYWTIALPLTLEALDTTVKLRQGASIFSQKFDFSPYQNIQLTLDLDQTPSPKPTNSVKKREFTQTPVTAPEATRILDQALHSAVAGIALENGASNKKPAEHKPSLTVVPTSDLQTERIPTPNPRTPETSAPSARKVDAALLDQDPTAADRLLASLRPDNRFLLQQVLVAYRNDVKTKLVTFLPHGVGISHHELLKHDKNITEFFEELSSKQWLWMDKSKPGRKIHPITVNGETQRLVILKPSIAHALGLIEAVAI